jgi:hypothetical protein
MKTLSIFLLGLLMFAWAPTTAQAHDYRRSAYSRYYSGHRHHHHRQYTYRNYNRYRTAGYSPYYYRGYPRYSRYPSYNPYYRSYSRVYVPAFGISIFR